MILAHGQLLPGTTAHVQSIGLAELSAGGRYLIQGSASPGLNDGSLDASGNPMTFVLTGVAGESPQMLALDSQLGGANGLVYFEVFTADGMELVLSLFHTTIPLVFWRFRGSATGSVISGAFFGFNLGYTVQGETRNNGTATLNFSNDSARGGMAFGIGCSFTVSLALEQTRLSFAGEAVSAPPGNPSSIPASPSRWTCSTSL